MGFWARLFGIEQRESEAPQESPQETTLSLSDFLNIIGTTERMTAEKAMEIPAFSASVDFIAQTVAELPIELYKEVKGERKAEQITDDPRLFALNDEAEYLMTALEAKKALITDMLLYGAGYMYIGEGAKTLHYVDYRSVSVQKNADPIFKDADIRVNERRFYPWQFVIVTRRSKDGVTGVGAVAEHETVLSAAYNIMKYENTVSRTGGNKKGFLQSEKGLTQDAITALKQAWAEFYANNENQMMVLNNGIKYTPSASTAMEMQLSQNKAANAAQIAQIFGLSPEAVSGRVDNNGFISSMKNAVLPVVAAFKQALNRSLLTESEKRGESPLYFELDTSALLRADTLSRYQAYAVALQNSFLQIDEVRYMEDKEPLGFDYMKLGLDSVLLDPKTGMLYTPNTNQFTKMGEKPLINADESGIIEERAKSNYIQDPKTGQMMGSYSESGGGKGGKGQKNTFKSEKMGIKEFVRLSHQIATDFPTLPPGDKLYPYDNRNHFYIFSVNDFGSYNFHFKIKIEGNEDKIREIRKAVRNTNE